VTGLKFWAPCDSVGPPNWGIWSAADTALYQGCYEALIVNLLIVYGVMTKPWNDVIHHITDKLLWIRFALSCGSGQRNNANVLLIISPPLTIPYFSHTVAGMPRASIQSCSKRSWRRSKAPPRVTELLFEATSTACKPDANVCKQRYRWSKSTLTKWTACGRDSWTGWSCVLNMCIRPCGYLHFEYTLGVEIQSFNHIKQ